MQSGAGLQASIRVIDPSGVEIASLAAPAIGGQAILPVVHTTTTGTYRVLLAGDAGTAGSYSIQTILNADLEDESHGGPKNDTIATAQVLDADGRSAFTQPFPDKNVDRAAVIGRTDPSSFQAEALPYSFEDISQNPASHAILQGADDSSYFLSESDLQGFQPYLNGVAFDWLTVSANGYVYSSNGNGYMAVYALSRDLLISGASDSAVYWLVDGEGADRRLIIQWQDVQFFGAQGAGLITFQAILNGDGSVEFVYPDLQVDSPYYNEGFNSGVEIDAYNYNTYRGFYYTIPTWNAPNQFVGTGRRTRLADQEATPDYYAFTLAAGQDVSVAVAAPWGGAYGLSLQLLDASGNILATGVVDASGNLSIANATPGTGTYYVQVAGDGAFDYDLVVTRGAVFDSGGNDTLASAQSLAGDPVAYGHLDTWSDLEDNYSFNAVAGQVIHLWTITPGDLTPGVGNTLDPQLELYDASGTLLVRGTPAADGRNEVIDFTVPDGASGTYVVRVASEHYTSGDYVLDPTSLPAGRPHAVISNETPVATAPGAPAAVPILTSDASNLVRRVLPTPIGRSGLSPVRTGSADAGSKPDVDLIVLDLALDAVATGTTKSSRTTRRPRLIPVL